MKEANAGITMIEPNASIRIMVQAAADGSQPELTYAWEGGNIAYLPASDIEFVHKHVGGFDLRHVRPGGRIQFDTFRLLLIDNPVWPPAALAVRVGWPGEAIYWWAKLYKWLRLVRGRLVATAEIWNLAECDPREYKTFSDLKIVRKWKRLTAKGAK